MKCQHAGHSAQHTVGVKRVPISVSMTVPRGPQSCDEWAGEPAEPLLLEVPHAHPVPHACPFLFWETSSHTWDLPLLRVSLNRTLWCSPN